MNSIYKPEPRDCSLTSQHAANAFICITRFLFVSLLSKGRGRRDGSYKSLTHGYFWQSRHCLLQVPAQTKEDCSWSAHKPSATDFTSLVQGQKPHSTASDNSAHLSSFLSWATSSASVHTVNSTKNTFCWDSDGQPNIFRSRLWLVGNSCYIVDLDFGTVNRKIIKSDRKWTDCQFKGIKSLQ